MGEEKISLDSGILVGLSKKDSCHQIGIHIGDEDILLIYEHGSAIHSSYDEIKELILTNKAISGVSKSNSFLRNLSRLKNDSYSILISNLNLTGKSIEFFDILKQNLNEMNSLEVGDVLFFDRGLFEHSAILSNLETFEVVHKNSKHDSAYLLKSILESNKNVDKAGEIRVNYILDVIKDSRIQKNNFYDTQFPPCPKDEIIKRAFENLGPEDYDVLNSNCQHFVFLKRNNVNKAPGIEKYKKEIENGLAAVMETMKIKQDILESDH